MGDLVDIPALEQHIRGLLGIGGGKPRHIPHFCVKEQILKTVRLVHIEPVYAELFKGHNVVLAGGVVELLQLGLQIFLGTLQLLDGKVFGAAGLELRDAVLDLPDLLLQEPFLPLSGHGDALKLAVADDTPRHGSTAKSTRGMCMRIRARSVRRS